jgi:hypothetical protein
MTKYAALGTQLLRVSTAIAHVNKISGPNLSLDTEDVTGHDSTGAWEEVVGTILRSGEVTLEIEYDPNHATHKNATGGLIADMVTRVTHVYSLVFPVTPAVTWTFDALVTGFNPGSPHNGALTAAVKLKISGEPTLA